LADTIGSLVDGLPLRVASLDDIIASKKAAGRDRDKAVLPIPEKTLKSIRERERWPGKAIIPPPSVVSERTPWLRSRPRASGSSRS